MKKDKGEIIADILYYVMLTMIFGALIALIINAFVKEFVG